MPDLKLVVYKTNQAPRTFRFTSWMIYRTFILISVCTLITIICLALATRFYLKSRSQALPVQEATLTPDLKDQIETLEARLKNQADIQKMPKEMDSKNPTLALFAPIISDQTLKQQKVALKNFKISQNQKTISLTFELHNQQEPSGAQKGYIVVLAKGSDELKAYPKIFNIAGPYLLDFEKGETFNVQRFRSVNASFTIDSNVVIKNFQVLIFERNGDLLINQEFTEENNARTRN